MATRQEVYAAIDSERDYQENLSRNEFKQQTPMEHVSIIRTIVNRSDDHWYDVAGQLPMDFMRKIAGVAVRAMEQHGAPKRGGDLSAKYVQYEHHGTTVWVDASLKGKHREHCLCFACEKFRPGTPENCPIAQATFENCVKFNTTTPVFECPEFVQIQQV